MRTLAALILVTLSLAACTKKTTSEEGTTTETTGARQDTTSDSAIDVKLPSDKEQLRFFALTFAFQEGFAGEVLINGVSLVTFSELGAAGSTNEVTAWLFPGENTVEIVATAIAPSNEPDRPPLRLTLHGLSAPGLVSKDNALWTVEGHPGPDLPGSRHYTFTLPPHAAPLSLLMEKAEQVQALTEEDEKALTALTRTIFDSVMKGDPALLKASWTFKMEEQARLIGWSEAEVDRILNEMAEPMAAAFADAEMPDELEFSLVAGGRVVQVTQPSGKSAIHVEADEDGFEIPIFLSRIDGQWVLVR